VNWRQGNQLILRRSFIQGAVGSMALASSSCRVGPGEKGRASERRLVNGALEIVADVVVYGATPAGVIAAVEAASAGRSVVIFGGWREHHLGGMIAGGLGWTDILDPWVIGGRAKEFLRATNTPSEGSAFSVDPTRAEQYFQKLVRTHGVTVIWTSGVQVVEKAGLQIKRLITQDGQRAVGRVYIDASYEGDLLARAGVSYNIGREAADAQNQINGFRGAAKTAGSDDHQFSIRGRLLQVDPFIVPGDPASGLIAGVKAWPDQPLGSSDRAVQSYNFRLTMSDKPELRIDLPSTPPDGYRPSDYEGLFRYLEAIAHAGLKHGRDWTFRDDLVLALPIGKVYDVNARGGFSLDPFGLSWSYPEAPYEARKAIWKAHEAYTRGYFYALGWDPDPRVPMSLRTEVRSWGLARGYYNQPSFGDAQGWPYQLYIREARRMQGDFILNGADINIPTAQAPRAGDVVAMASYREDSHHVQRLAIPSENGGWRLWNEGNFEVNYDSRFTHSPVPYGVIIPQRRECSNLLVPFCVSATHQGFSAIRTELTAMALGQASGAAAAIMCELGAASTVQDVPYSVLRNRLQRTNSILAKPSPFDNLKSRIEQKLVDLAPRH